MTEGTAGMSAGGAGDEGATAGEEDGPSRVLGPIVAHVLDSGRVMLRIGVACAVGTIDELDAWLHRALEVLHGGEPFTEFGDYDAGFVDGHHEGWDAAMALLEQEDRQVDEEDTA